MVPNSLFDVLSEEQHAHLLRVGRRRQFRRQEVVVHRGDPADTLHVIRKGRFSVEIVTPLGQTAILTVLGPGQTFGELALVSGDQVRSATVVALEPAETLSIHQIDFASLRRENPAFGDFLVVLLANQVRRLTGQLVEALFVDADRRVLRRLWEMAVVYGGDEAEAGTAVPLTQEMLAAVAGTSRSTVNRVLRDAERDGIVGLGRGRTVVRDRAALERRAGVRR